MESQNILIVDDSPSNAEVLKEMLIDEHHHAFAVESGVEALEWLQKHNADLILLDVMMPQMDGFELCRILKNNHLTNDIPVIFLTARSDEDSVLEGFAAGGVDYVSKPFRRTELLARIRTHLELNYSRTRLKHELQQRQKAENATRANEQKFRNLFNASIDPILILTHKGVIAESNETAFEVFKTEKNDLLRKKIHEIFANFSTDYINKLLEGCKQKGVCTFTTQVKADSKILDVEVNMRQIEYGHSKAIMLILHDVTEQKTAHKKILQAIIDTENKERKRFAQNLHDDLGPLLSTLKMYFSALERGGENLRDQNILTNAKEVLSEALYTAKNIANDLSPHVLENFGLKTAIYSFVQRVEFASSLKIQVLMPDELSNIASNIQTTIYRVVTELIHNTLKHANANFVKLEFNTDKEWIEILYSDNGQGFELSQYLQSTTQGMGLSNIISRVSSLHGQINIESSKGNSFFAKIKFPINFA